MINEGVRNCRICKKEIEVYSEKFGGSFGSKAKQIIQSNEGVLFHKCVWFCNGCYEEILKYYREQND